MLNYKLVRNIEPEIERHVDRIKRLAEFATTDRRASSVVQESLQFVKRLDPTKGEDLEQFVEEARTESTKPINNPVITIDENSRQSENYEQQGNGGLQQTASSGSEPQTLLILTVGTNALPVWVAWYHLRNKLKGPIRVQLVHTRETEDEMERLNDQMGKYYSDNPGSVISTQTSPGDPRCILTDIATILNSQAAKTPHLHVHYTGGTQVMGVETVSAATAFAAANDRKIDTSYLTVHAKLGPALINRQKELVEDTRVGVFGGLKSIDFLRLIALLNGFEVGKFTHTYRGRSYECPDPVQFTCQHLEVGRKLLEDMQRGAPNVRKLLNGWLSQGAYDGNKGEFAYPLHDMQFNSAWPTNNPLWQETLLPFFKEVYCCLNWHGGSLFCPARAQATDPQVIALEQIHKFFTGVWFEYAAYAAFEAALSKIDENLKEKDRCDNKRSDYALFHSVHVRRAKAKKEVRDFELDVVAVLGHQIVLVSCTFSDHVSLIKGKGMEALHRARQLGGDEARAIVLCKASKNDATLLEEELKDEMGSASEPLQIWGLNEWSQLTQKFEEYCEELHWE